MKQIDFYLDFISPYAYLAFEKLPEALMGISYSVHYRPILFAGLLKAHGQLGPAEIAPKREWTYRQVLWLAKQHGVALQMPAAHPFNPLPLLRLALAASRNGRPNRYVCEAIFRHVWHGGYAADAIERLTALHATLAPSHDPQSPEIKAQLQANSDQALALGLFGVPSFVVDGKIFWGFDALSMLRAYCTGDPWFASDGPWGEAGRTATGQTRRP